MALETNAYKRAAATTDKIIPNLYNEMAEKYLYEREVLRPLCIDNSARILGKAGSSFETYKGTAFSVSSLTEGTDTPVSAMDFNNVTLTVAWYGDAKQMSKEVISESFSFLMDDLSYGAANAMGVNRDVQIMTEMLNTTQSAIYPISTGVTRVTEANILATSVLTYEQITEAWRVMRLNQRNLKDVIVHPNQLKELMNDEKFIEADNYTASITGEIGKMTVGDGGIRIFAHTAVQTNAEGASDLVTVYQAIGLAPRSIMYAQKVNPVFEFDEEIKRKRAITFHYYEAFGVKILNTEGIVPIKSA